MFRFKLDNEDVYRVQNNYTERAHHYKFEHGGMLVYDSKAIVICGQHAETGVKQSPVMNKTISAAIKKELESADPAGNSKLEANYFTTMKDYTPSPSFPYEYILEVPNDSVTLRFNSKFESGNLYKAIKLSDYDYQLYINNDIGTYNQNHWYYFSVINPRKTCITLNIVNMRKKDVHYLNGMQPAVYSTRLYQEKGISWHRDGLSISYKENAANKSTNFVGRGKYYTLSFSYQYRYENDQVYFAYSVPYTYTDLVSYLDHIKTHNTETASISPLCETIAGNICYKLIITDKI